jgi:restriction system protein
MNQLNQKNYYRIMLGRKSIFAKECYEGKWIGAGWLKSSSLENELVENWRDFNKKFIPNYLSTYDGSSKVAAGLACSMLHGICKGIEIDDLVLCPDGEGNYLVGEVKSDYFFIPETELPHRRKVEWYEKKISRTEMSIELQRSTGSTGTVSKITKYAEEIENLIKGNRPSKIYSDDETIEDPSTFAMEKHLEDFLINNWSITLLGKTHDIFEEDGEKIGQQYQTDTGNIDILAISKDKKELLVVELKKGRASDSVVGQILRYMGYITTDLAEPDQIVRGCIIALEDDLRIKNALKITPSIDFYRYEVSFNLKKN